MIEFLRVSSVAELIIFPKISSKTKQIEIENARFQSLIASVTNLTWEFDSLFWSNFLTLES